MPEGSPIILTFHAANEDEAIAIVSAVRNARGPGSEEVLVTPNGPAPTGHSYRELSEARRRGELDAVVTPQGLVFQRAALEAYRRHRTARRTRPKGDAIPTETELDASRARALEARGVPVRRKAL